ncbi:hypothetical protein CC86DRAFT_471667 [Ophiobolus disseminans]|uniref:Uncharacterized protein n=1 Tax=Ophiobolus disseminans TaxID=1469910 RepID=A0A6A6ZIE0_9PLEO|nr:hypothetical protein CC86DRAFT_471667 [Ophiobolus disseminans]
MIYANYLPNELLLAVVTFFEHWETNDRQVALARFCAVNRQWYDVAIQQLYDSPHLSGKAYDLFVRTICPSVLAHIKPSSLSGLVRVLDLGHIIHHSTKATTARLLGRTKPSLQVFVAPQASFAINCWASLSKCTRLRVLDLSLVSECISFQSLNQTLRQLVFLRELYLPRCSASHDEKALSTHLRWPPLLEHVSLSGSISEGQFLWDMLRQPDTFPPTLYSLSILHSPRLGHRNIKSLLSNLADSLTVVELRDLPAIKHGRFNNVLNWLPNLTSLSIAIDYIDTEFGNMPLDFSSSRWREAKPLQKLTLVSSGQTSIDPSRSFTAVDLYALIDERFLSRLRYLYIAQSTGWCEKEEAEIGALDLLLDELDKENWTERRWHYEYVAIAPTNASYEEWVNTTSKGREMRPRLKILRNR